MMKNVNIAFLEAVYGICTHHLKQNLCAKFKEIELNAIVELIAKAYRSQQFNYVTNKIQKVNERMQNIFMMQDMRNELLFILMGCIVVL